MIRIAVVFLGLFVATYATAKSLFVAPLASHGLFVATPSKVAAYWWGGTISGVHPGYSTGQSKLDSLLTSAGLSTARVFLGAQSDVDYTNGGSCITGSSLTAEAQTTNYVNIFSDSNVSTFILTAYDWTSQPNCSTKNYLVPSFFTPAHTASVQSEWQTFASYLASTYPTKTFILDAWEGDNDCWCGSSFTATLSNCPGGPSNVSGFLLWVQARTAGIHAANVTNVKAAIEMNDFGPLSSQGLPNILQNVATQVALDYVSYSSWESKASYQRLVRDVQSIRATLGYSGPKLFIGELGVPDSFATTDGTQYIAYINAMRGLGLPYIVQWDVLFNTPFGAYDDSGNLTQLGAQLGAFGPQ